MFQSGDRVGMRSEIPTYLVATLSPVHVVVNADESREQGYWLVRLAHDADAAAVSMHATQLQLHPRTFVAKTWSDDLADKFLRNSTLLAGLDVEQQDIFVQGFRADMGSR